MRKQLPCLLMLATLALTSSNLILHDDTLAFSTEPDDITKTINTRLIINTLLCSVSTDTATLPKLCKLLADYNKREINIYKGNSLDASGFRNKQWHNYPRQLDRLQNYLSERHKPNFHDMFGNNHDNIEGLFNGHEKHENQNPFLTIETEPNKIVSNEITPITESISILYHGLRDEINANHESNDLKPALNAIQTKITLQPEESKQFEPEDLENSDESSLPVQKRVFSVLSRLQSLSHQGHELHHRRHLHAFYGISEDQLRALAADGRLAQLRPPGSPLRWG